jgi:UDP-N-acetylmuramate--alanine ligase
MHVFFSGIGGTAIGPLALIAKQAGYTVSGSDKQDSQYIEYLKKQGIDNIHIGQSEEQITEVHARQPIHWYVYSSAVAIEQPDAPELKFCEGHGIKATKRDELINHIVAEKNLKMIAVAGTHGKTTTTAMAVWLFKQLNIPISYSVGAKISFGEMGQFDPSSEYFVYEADEFDRNFLAFKPYVSLITGIDYDHHEIFPTREDYQDAFKQFLSQSTLNVVWHSDAQNSRLTTGENYLILNDNDEKLNTLSIVGAVNRRDAWQVIQAVSRLTDKPEDELISTMNNFPGLSRRFEKITNNLYSDYAHTVPKIQGCLQQAFELSDSVVVVYEPLTNRRQEFIKEGYKELFKGVKKLYWVPSYLAREDPETHVYSPSELIEFMDNKEIAQPSELDQTLEQSIRLHLAKGDLVVAISGGGGNSLDEWIREKFIK